MYFKLVLSNTKPLLQAMGGSGWGTKKFFTDSSSKVITIDLQAINVSNKDDSALWIEFCGNYKIRCVIEQTQ